MRDAGITDIYVTAWRNGLEVNFGARPLEVNHHANGYTVNSAEGARYLLILVKDGKIRSIRQPYSRTNDPNPDYEIIAEFNNPKDVTADFAANSVADFIEWVTNGAGNGGLPITFF